MTATASGTLFTLKDVSVKTPAGVAWVDIPYVMEASLKSSHTTVDLFGDNRLQDKLYHTKQIQVTVKANKLAMLAMETITGVSSVISGTNDELDIGRESELNAPVVLTVRAQTRFVDDDGTDKTATIYLYHCKCAAALETVDSGHGKVVEANFAFDAFLSTKDENNATIATEAFGRYVLPQ